MELPLYRTYEYALGERSITISMLQRALRLGYPKASKTIDYLVNVGVLIQSCANKKFFDLRPMFECYWCKRYAGLSRDDYTRKIEFLGGFDVDGMPICDGCMDDALSVGGTSAF